MRWSRSLAASACRVLLFVSLFLTEARLAAQEQTSTLTGIVSSEGAGAVAGARVTASRASGRSVEATTASDGSYVFPVLPPGKYEVRVERDGFAPWVLGAVDLPLGRTLRLDVVLQASRREEIAVRSETPLLDVTQSASFTNLRGAQVTLLPRGRDYTSLVSQAPSARSEPKLAGISIDGASASENRYVLDGLDTTNLQTGAPGAQLVTDFVEEIQVKSSGYPAEYGGSTGGVINVVTRGGTNEWKGDVGAYLSSNALDGPVRRGLRFVPTDDTRVERFGFPEDAVTRWEPGVAIGGPLVRDDVWLFASYVPQLQTTRRDVTFVANGRSDTFTQQDDTHNALLSLSAQPSARFTLKASAYLSPAERYGTLPSQDGNGNPAVPYSDLDQVRPNTGLTSSLDVVLSPRAVVGLRGGYFRYNRVDYGIPDEPLVSFDGTNGNFPGVPPSLVRPSGFASILTNEAITRDVQSRLSVEASGSYTVDWLGRHELKVGAQLDRMENDVKRGEQEPVITLEWDRTLTTLDGRRVRGAYGYYRVRQRQTSGDVHSDDVALFAQDAWQVGRRVTVNVGLRAESEYVPSYASDPGVPRKAISFGFGEKLAPRLGIAWDVAGDGRWKAYASWGVFYDVMKLELARSSFGGDKWLDYRYSLDSYDWTAIPGPACPPACPGTLYEVVDYRHVSNDPNDNLIDPNLRPMRSQEIAAGLERQVSTQVAVSVRYVHKQLDRVIEDVGTIVPGVGEVYFIANPGYGLAEHTIGAQFPAQPKARRDYDALELSLRKQFSGGFGLWATYVVSRLWGNYSGLASSDEYGRTSPNVSRAFDSILNSFDQNGRPVYGPLATDRPHQLKIQGTGALPFGLTAGLSYSIASGTPITRYVEMQSNIPVYYAGRGSDGRTPWLSQTDVYLQREFELGRVGRLQISVNVLNLFDQATRTSVFSAETRDVIAISNESFFGGFDAQKLIAAQGTRRDPRFLQADQFQAPRSVRLGAKLMF